MKVTNLQHEITQLKQELTKSNKNNKIHIDEKYTLLQVIEDCETENDEFMKDIHQFMKEIDELKNTNTRIILTNERIKMELEDKYAKKLKYSKENEINNENKINNLVMENTHLKNKITQLEIALISTEEKDYLTFNELAITKSKLECTQEELEITKTNLTNYERQVSYLEDVNLKLRNLQKNNKLDKNNLDSEYEIIEIE